jgi:phosphinothricin acetyltransferase
MAAHGVSVRPGGPADLPALTDVYNHYVTHTAISFDLVPATIEQRAEWLSHYADSGPHRLLVAVGGDAVVGFATSSTFRERPAYATSVETSVYCRHDRTGEGIGSVLYTAVFEALRGEDVHRAYAGTTLPNDASLALHKRFGFTDIGVFHQAGRKFGRYWDVLWMEKALS